MTMAVRSQIPERRVITPRGKRAKGQATIELALVLPFIIWLMFYTFNAFYTIHTGHVFERYAAMNLWMAVDNRAQFVMDDVRNQLHNKSFMAIQFMGINGDLPRRKIISGPIQINSVVGVCREPGCQ